MRQRRQHGARARTFLRPRRGPADEDLAAACRIAAASNVVRSGDDELADIRRLPSDVETLHARAVQPQVDRRWHLRTAAASPGTSAAAPRTWRFGFDFQIFTRRCYADRVKPRLDRHAH